MAVLFNEYNQVLLIQEAKESCRGMWYLPAGRLEPNETLVQGVKREVKEEAGLTCDIITLLEFHFGGAPWMRFSFLGKITGGKLKTLAEQDRESLQACFYDVTSVCQWKVNLRSGDIIPVIQLAMEYKESMGSVPKHPVLQPVTVGHSLLLHRFLLVADNGQDSSMMMLAATEGGAHILTCAISPRDPSLLITVHALIRTAIAGETFCPTVHGVVGVEHNGTEPGKDGMCLTTLVSLALPKGKGLPALRSEDFTWVPVTDMACLRFLQEGMNGHLCKCKEK